MGAAREIQLLCSPKATAAFEFLDQLNQESTASGTMYDTNEGTDEQGAVFSSSANDQEGHSQS